MSYSTASGGCSSRWRDFNRIDVARLLPDGTADPTFGVAGVASLVPSDVPSGYTTGGAHRLLVRSDDSVLAIASYGSANILMPSLVAFAQFLTTGERDPAFDSGVFATPLGGAVQNATILTDGKILVASPNTWARLAPNGIADPGFGPNGTRAANLPPGFPLNTIAFRSDGAVIVAGVPGLIRLIPSLIVDPTFAGGSGIAPYPTPLGNFIPSDITLDTTSIVVTSPVPGGGVVRFTAAGILDAAFGTGGVVTDPLERGIAEVAITPLGILGSGGTTPSHLVRWLARSGFKLSTTPTSLTIGGGETATITAAIVRDSGFTAPVSVSFISNQTGLKATPSSAVLFGAGLSSTATISVDTTVPAGTYPLRVRAFSSGLPSQERVVSVVVPPCRLALAEPAVTLAPGGEAQNIGITLARSASCQGSASFTVTGLPPGNPPLGSGIGVSFTPNPTTGSTSTLRIHALRFAPPQDLQVVVRATIGTTVVTAPLLIEVVDLH